MPKCWLIGDAGGHFPLLPAQFARLRNLQVEFLSVPEQVLPHLPADGRNMLAIRFEHLQRLSTASIDALQARVAGGAVLYVRGGARPGTWAPLGLFGGAHFSVAAHQDATAYHLRRHPLMPAALADESEQGRFVMPGADDLPVQVEPLVVAEHSDGRMRPALFAKRLGEGLVLYDLHPDDGASDTPIVARFADPVSRPRNLGALIAADWTVGIDPRTPAAFNLTLDDRPSNLDFFNVANLRNFLDRVDARLPRAHVDFAWTPDQSHPSRRYVDTLKQYRTGFVWHGFLRHVDHRSLGDPARELAEGKRAVETISRRYDVRFQPVMVFPYERDSPQCVEVMRGDGFRAEVRSLEGPPAACESVPEYLRFSVPERSGDGHRFVMLYRKAIECLCSDWMLALAALGLPVLAAAHPEDLALRRFARSPWLPDSFEELDRVLEFAAAKSLRPCSLEEIAAEMTVD